MRRAYVGLSCTAAIALSLLAVPHMAHAQQASAASPSHRDSLAARLVELELQRVSVSNESSAITDPRDAGARIDTIHAQLRSLSDGAVAEREATSRVILALDARASALQAHRQQLRLAFTDDHPAVRRTQNEAQAIGRRIAELRNAK